MPKSSYLTQHTNPTIPQSEPLDERQEQNKAGGYTYKVGAFHRLERFLIIGTEGGTYYASETDITKENVENLKYCISEDGVKTVNTIKEISLAGRAPKVDPSIFALALAFAKGNAETKQAVESAYKGIIRTGTHHLMFVSFVDQLRGWGASLRRLVGSWYDRDEDGLAYQVLKYQERGGWSHADVLSKCHFGRNTPLFRWIMGREYGPRELDWNTTDSDGKGVVHSRKYCQSNKQGIESRSVRVFDPENLELPEIITAYEQIKKVDSKSSVIHLIERFRLTHEMVPNQWKNDPDVWEALLQHMPMTAMIRNLAKMTSIGLLTGLSDATQKVISSFSKEVLHQARVHPINILVALKTYSKGRGMRGSLEWKPVSQIVDALDGAFYDAFETITPINKPIIIALDVSGSMFGGHFWSSHNVLNVLSPAEAAAAMAMATARVEDRYEILAFSTQVVPFDITPRDSLKTVVEKMENMPMGGTDCAAAILEARRRGLKADAFIMYTDNETWAGRIHPTQALKGYSMEMGIEAKLCTVGMTATQSTINDPDLRYMLDVVGFASNTPALISSFVSGDVKVF